MASVFAYEPDPPRIASPWSAPPAAIPAPRDAALRCGEMRDDGEHDAVTELGGLLLPEIGRLERCGLLSLQPEPQTGPIEYKLHLLLRPRQTFALTTTASPNGDARASSKAARPKPQHGAASDYVALHAERGSGGDDTDADADAATTGSVGSWLGRGGVDDNDAGLASNSISAGLSTPSSRQQRLLHLTTQLLWRLKQSSPHHAFSAVDSVKPKLPDASGTRLRAPVRPEKLLPGLEESQGAMYEIGVADDGTFVGLTRDEMEESLVNLRVMAASLGCKVSLLRAVIVGTCRPAPSLAEAKPRKRHASFAQGTLVPAEIEDLYVVEALVLPDTGNSDVTDAAIARAPDEAEVARRRADVEAERLLQDTEQLRVSLTGSTTSGKSTLLGTLLASTFDDARGKSRLNLLKHRHEIASGVTSSVAHELLGYQKTSDTVVNYAYRNVDTWTSVHDNAEGGRLVLLTDSAGHPRYRRTIVRSLVAWQPHWTLCCIAAIYQSDGGDPVAPVESSADGNSLSPAQLLAIAHLELCLKLKLPLVVVVTKYDIAARAVLRQTLSRILTILKKAGRVPHLLKPSGPVTNQDDLQKIPDHDMHEMRTVIDQMRDDYSLLVPIVLTSAVNGVGITKLHALLRQLPVPESSDSNDTETATATTESLADHPATSVLFDVDEIFVKDVQLFSANGRYANSELETRTYVLSGLLQRGTISVGETLLLGPFPTEESWASKERRPPLDMRRTASYPVTLHELAMRRQAKMGLRRRRSSEDIQDGQGPSRVAFSGDHAGDDSPSSGEDDGNGASIDASEWLPVRVSSVRNLRLPVRTLFGGQCATVGVSMAAHPGMASTRPRKGMVLVKPRDRSSDQAELSEDDTEAVLSACRTFNAIFPFDDYQVMEPGAQFNIYVGSIRALAKVVTVGLVDRVQGTKSQAALEENPSFDDRLDEEDLFRLDGTPNASAAADRNIEVMFQLPNSREYMEVGTKILVMPGHAGEGSEALGGYVGWISDVMR